MRPFAPIAPFGPSVPSTLSAPKPPLAPAAPSTLSAPTPPVAPAAPLAPAAASVLPRRVAARVHGTLRSRVAWLGLLALFPLAVRPAPARAQDYWDDWDNMYAGQPKTLSLSGTVGRYWSSPWNDLVLLGSVSNNQNGVQEVLLRQVQVNPATVYGGSVTYRRGRAGARLQVSYAKSCLSIAGSCEPAAQGSPTPVPLPRRIDVKTWTAAVEGEAGLLPWRQATWAHPYVLVGGGAVVYDPSATAADLLPVFLEFPGGTARTEGNNVFVQFPGAGDVVASVQGAGMQTLFAAVLGIGTDLRVPVGNGGFGIRIQATDHIAASPMHVRILQGGSTIPANLNFGAIHNFELSAGAVLDFDLGKVKRKVAWR